jgi:hypothetical protein
LPKSLRTLFIVVVTIKMAFIKISVLNESTVVSDKEIEDAMPAFQTQVSRDFAKVWGVDADLKFIPKGSNADPGSWWIGVFDDSDQAGALGYHDLTPEGLPLGKVFAGTDKKYGYQWTVTFSHELLEMLGDPDINLTALVQKDDTTGTMYAYEVCDACEADENGYKINNVLVSDFVYPSWFESFWKKDSGTQFDQMKKIHTQFELLPGGYIGAFDVGSGTGWHQITADGGASMKYSNRAHVGSRRERRRTPRNQWLVSNVKNDRLSHHHAKTVRVETA